MVASVQRPITSQVDSIRPRFGSKERDSEATESGGQLFAFAATERRVSRKLHETASPVLIIMRGSFAKLSGKAVGVEVVTLSSRRDAEA
jgi:hypothetical protein